MRTGQYYRLNCDTMGVDNSGRKPTAVTVPAGAIICVTGAHDSGDPRMIEVKWQDSRVVMFAVDVHERGERIMGASESQA